MKKYLFYLLILVQVLILLVLTYQFEKIDHTGKEITLSTLPPDFPVYDDYIDGDMYVEYKINKIPEDKWESSLAVDYQTIIYVLLQKDDEELYEVKKASTDKLFPHSENEFVLKGTYQYYDTEHNIHYVDYGIRKIKHVDQFGKFKPNDELKVTILIGKWGQYKVTGIEKWENKTDFTNKSNSYDIIINNSKK